MEEAELYFKIQNIGYIVGWIIMGILLIWGIVITLIERKKK